MRIDPVYFAIQRKAGTEEKEIPIGCVAGARFASRDMEGMRKALDEQIAREGRYSGASMTNPSIFRITRDRLTQSDTFEVQGAHTGGEVEIVAIRTAEEVLISVGSDQCDRELDPLFPDKPKQMCPHPMAKIAWPYEEVRDHWDELKVYSEVSRNGQTITLQDSTLSTLVSLEYLLSMDVVKNLPDPMFLYCGTANFLPSAAEQVEKLDLPEMTCHGVGDSFLVRLTDPVLGRTIEHQYSAIPVGDDYDERKDRGVLPAPHH
tara:strand:+ start:768 stop:1553 length:786 start_codon:yes stop_codon:yes gene_type:complete